MRIAIHSSAFQHYVLRDALEEIRRLGYTYVELSASISGTSHFAAHSADYGQIVELRNALGMFGLQVVAIDIGGWDPPLCMANLDESQRAMAVENVKRVIDVAADLDCPLITSHFWGLPEGRAPSLYRKAFGRSIREVCPLVEERDVQLSFMPHPGGFIEGSDPSVDLAREVGCPHIGYTYGIGHSFVISRPGQDARHMVEYAGDLLAHVLVSDTYKAERIIAPPEAKAHLHMTPGEGDVDFPSVFGAFKKIGYSGFLSVHLISEKDRIVKAAEESRRRLKKLLDILDP